MLAWLDTDLIEQDGHEGLHNQHHDPKHNAPVNGHSFELRHREFERNHEECDQHREDLDNRCLDYECDEDCGVW